MAPVIHCCRRNSANREHSMRDRAASPDARPGRRLFRHPNRPGLGADGPRSDPGRLDLALPDRPGRGNCRISARLHCGAGRYNHSHGRFLGGVLSPRSLCARGSRLAHRQSASPLAGRAQPPHCRPGDRLALAPTPRAAENLLGEGAAADRVAVTGNTVIDALMWTVNRQRNQYLPWQEKYVVLGSRRMVLITGHRRENFGDGLEQICHAILMLSGGFPDVEFVYPVHLNPNVRKSVGRLLANSPNIHLIEPAPYPEFVWLMDRSTLILTDSGGVQEEAPSLRKPVLVMRETTERPEAVQSGAARLVGTDVQKIVEQVSLLLTDPAEYASRQIDVNPYGDGYSAQRIVDLILCQEWQNKTSAGLKTDSSTPPKPVLSQAVSHHAA